MKITTIPKDWQKIARAARKAGWAIFLNGNGKLSWWGPDGQKVTTGATPTRNGHAAANHLQWLKRAGVPGA